MRVTVDRNHRRRAWPNACAAVVLAWLEQREDATRRLRLDQLREGIVDLYSVPTIRQAIEHLVERELLEVDPPLGHRGQARQYTVRRRRRARAA